MIVFDVRCNVLEPIKVSDPSGSDITIAPGSYRLRGLDHLIRSAGGDTVSTGTDLTFVGDGDGQTIYTVRAENLAHFIALDEVEVKAT